MTLTNIVSSSDLRMSGDNTRGNKVHQDSEVEAISCVDKPTEHRWLKLRVFLDDPHLHLCLVTGPVSFHYRQKRCYAWIHVCWRLCESTIESFSDSWDTNLVTPKNGEYHGECPHLCITDLVTWCCGRRCRGVVVILLIPSVLSFSLSLYWHPNIPSVAFRR